MLEYRAGDVAAYKELKSLYTEGEWEEKREVIFKTLSSHTAVDKLYEIERLYGKNKRGFLSIIGQLQFMHRSGTSNI